MTVGTADGNTLTLCYQFAGEQFVIYPSITLRVKDLLDTSSGTIGIDKSRAVAWQEKSLVYTGVGVVPGADAVFYVPQGATCMAANRAHAQPSFGTAPVVTADGTEHAGVATATVVLDDAIASSSGGVLHLCYQFGSEPARKYSVFSVTVLSVQAVAVSAPPAVVGAATTLTFSGVGLAESDRVRWVSQVAQHDGHCLSTLEGASLAARDTSGASQWTLDDNLRLAVTFGSPLPVQRDGRLRLCYQFNGQPYRLLPHFHLKVHHLEALTLHGVAPHSNVTIDADDPEGGRLWAVVGLAHTLTVTGTGIGRGTLLQPATTVVNASITGDAEACACLTCGSLVPPPVSRPGATLAGSPCTALSRGGVIAREFTPEDREWVLQLAFDALAVPEGAMVDTVTLELSAQPLAATLPLRGNVTVAAVTMGPTNASLGEPWTCTSGSGGTPCATLLHASESVNSSHVRLAPPGTLAPLWSASALQSGFTVHLRVQAAGNETVVLSVTAAQLWIEYIDGKFEPQPALSPTVACLLITHGLFAPPVLAITGDHLRLVSQQNAGCGSDVTTMQLAVAPGTGTAGIVFDAMPSTRDAGLSVCYLFGSDPASEYVPYPKLRIAAADVEAVAVTSGGGSSRLAVGAPKVFGLHGVGIGSGPQTDVMAWVPPPAGGVDPWATNVTCDHALQLSPGGGTVSAVVPVGATTATVAAQSPAPSGALLLCYQFGSGQAKLFPNISLTVVEVTSVSAVGNRSSELAVAGVPKTFKLLGAGVASGDSVRWTDTGVCDDSSRGPTSPDDAEVVDSGSGTVTATSIFPAPATDASATMATWLLCYRFGASEPWLLLDASIAAIQVASIEGVSAADAATTAGVAVVGRAHTLVLHGTGMTEADSVRWSTRTGDCGSEFVAPGVPASLPVQKENATLRYTTSHVFLVASNGSNWQLCYRFRSESFVPVPDALLRVVQLRNVTAGTGATTVAVVGVSKRYTFTGAGTGSGDVVKFVAAPGDCSHPGQGGITLPGGLEDEGLMFTTSEVVTPSGSQVAALVMFARASGAEGWSACYKFVGMDSFVAVEPALVVSVRHLHTLEVAEEGAGTATAMVVRVPKRLRFNGDGVAPGDEAKFVRQPAQCNDTDLAIGGIVPQALGPNHTAVFEFTAPVATVGEDAPVILCYRFASEPFVAYPALAVGVKSLERLAVANGDPSVAIVSRAKEYTIVGTGMASGDLMRWVSANASDCGSEVPSQGAVAEGNGIVRSVDDAFVTTFTFGASSGGAAVWQLCYAFQGEPPQLQPAITVRVRRFAGVVRVSAGSSTAAVVGVPKTFVFDGDGLGNGDVFRWIAAGSSSCEAATVVKQASVTNNSATFTFTAEDVAASAAWVACYRFGSEAFEVFADVELEVRHLTSVAAASTGQDPSLAVVGMSKELLFGGPGVEPGDAVYWVPAIDSGCSPSRAQGSLPGNNGTTTLEPFLGLAGVAFTFASASAPADIASGGWKLCYRFDTEPDVLFDAIRIRVLQVGNVTVAAGGVGTTAAGAEVIVNRPAVVVFEGGASSVHGSGAAALDRVMWVTSAASEDSDCVGALAVQSTESGSKVAEVTTKTPSCRHPPLPQC